MAHNWIWASLLALPLAAQPDPAYQVRSLRVQVLSTMLTADEGVGEWGFAAVVEADGHRILFDTGARPNTVLNNAQELGVDLSNVTEVILSHNHSDHTGGLVTLRRALSAKNPAALAAETSDNAAGFLADNARRSVTNPPVWSE